MAGVASRNQGRTCQPKRLSSAAFEPVRKVTAILRQKTSRLGASLVVTACLALPACKRTPDSSKTPQPRPPPAQKSSAQAVGEDSLIQEAASRCRQRIQAAARDHAANARRMNEAKVLDMKAVTQREQVEAKREVVRKFLASNEALKSVLIDEETIFAQELAKQQVPQARIESALRGFQSGIPGKAMTIQMRAADQRIGDSALGALDYLDEIWGQWNYNKEYDRVQFSPPGALRKYTEFMEAIEAASKEQDELQGRVKAEGNTGP
jgi:hypothetical protein